MELINFDDPKDEKKTKHHFLLPDCHYMIVGQTGVGKTNLLLNLLLQYMNYEHCNIYTINPDQDKYQLLNEYSELFDDGDNDKVFEILQPEDVIPVEELDDETKKVIIFDDIKLDRRDMNNIKEYFSLSRNKNCNCIYLTQSYYDVPKYIRRNTKCFILFGGLDNKDVRHISDDLSKDIGRDKFGNIYREATSEPYDFMVVDKTSKHIPEMYRKKFDGFYSK